MMGYPMALNLRKKIPSSSKFYIYDVSKGALERFLAEAGSHGEVVIASSAKDVVDHAVHLNTCHTDIRTQLFPCCLKAPT
jgi:hypothetical protein